MYINLVFDLVHVDLHFYKMHRMTLEGKLSNNVAPIQSLALDDYHLVAGSRDRNVRVSVKYYLTNYKSTYTCIVGIVSAIPTNSVFLWATNFINQY